MLIPNIVYRIEVKTNKNIRRLIVIENIVVMLEQIGIHSVDIV